MFNNLKRFYYDAKGSKWVRYFTIFCRVALALGFIPSGIVKISGERFTALPSNHPLGHYFDTLFQTGYYYTFIGIAQLVIALLLLIPRTAHRGGLFFLRTRRTKAEYKSIIEAQGPQPAPIFIGATTYRNFQISDV